MPTEAEERVQAIEALAQILALTQTSEPSSYRKAELEKLRTQVIEYAMWGLGKAPEPTRFKAVDTEYLKAMRMVAGYEGNSTFMRDLQRAIAYYGGLTDRQAEAVLEPPEPSLLAELEKLGVETMPEYRWQGYDAKQAAKKRLRQERAS